VTAKKTPPGDKHSLHGVESAANGGLGARAARSAPAHREGDGYILIAIPSQNRADAIRQLALDLSSNVVVLRDGADVIRHIDSHGAPSLLITDISLPQVDGLEVLRHVRRRTAIEACSVVVVSAHEAMRAAARTLAPSLGIAKILPFDMDRPALREALSAAWLNARPAAATVLPAVGPVPTDDASPDVLVNGVLIELTRQFNVPMAVAYLRLPDREWFTSFTASHDAPSLFGSRQLGPLLAQVADSGEMLIVPDVESHPTFASASDPSIKGFASVPLVSAAGLHWGALGLVEATQLKLSADDFDALMTRAVEVGDRLDRLCAPAPPAAPSPTEVDIQRLEKLAATDPLTGLANRRGCEQALAAELSRARREKQPLSCVLLDVDRFKRINDTIGHQTGDNLLCQISAILRRSIRAYDIAARWGGEEFLLVLPGANVGAAGALAERIRLEIERMPTTINEAITVSGGVAEFDRDYNFERTLGLADQRLYQAKAAGRNCVI
jgi:diguanylate cyclase (GGDEF)-like protein